MIDFIPVELSKDLRYEERLVWILAWKVKELRNWFIPYVKICGIIMKSVRQLAGDSDAGRVLPIIVREYFPRYKLSIEDEIFCRGAAMVFQKFGNKNNYSLNS